jgi:hypothetical protein
MPRIDDGFSTRISFGADSSVEFWEKEVTPVSIEAGGPNDTTTMHNTTWRTRAPKKLKTLGEMSAVCAYDPAVYDSILPMIGVIQTITVTFPDGSTLEFYGWVDVFKPNRIVEGEQPTAEVTIIASNQDASGTEQPPTFTP